MSATFWSCGPDRWTDEQEPGRPIRRSGPCARLPRLSCWTLGQRPECGGRRPGRSVHRIHGAPTWRASAGRFPASDGVHQRGPARHPGPALLPEHPDHWRGLPGCNPGALRAVAVRFRPPARRRGPANGTFPGPRARSPIPPASSGPRQPGSAGTGASIGGRARGGSPPPPRGSRVPSARALRGARGARPVALDDKPLWRPPSVQVGAFPFGWMTAPSATRQRASRAPRGEVPRTSSATFPPQATPSSHAGGPGPWSGPPVDRAGAGKCAYPGS